MKGAAATEMTRQASTRSPRTLAPGAAAASASPFRAAFARLQGCVDST